MGPNVKMSECEGSSCPGHVSNRSGSEEERSSLVVPGIHRALRCVPGRGGCFASLPHRPVRQTWIVPQARVRSALWF